MRISEKTGLLNLRINEKSLYEAGAKTNYPKIHTIKLHIFLKNSHIFQHNIIKYYPKNAYIKNVRLNIILKVTCICRIALTILYTH